MNSLASSLVAVVATCCSVFCGMQICESRCDAAESLKQEFLTKAPLAWEEVYQSLQDLDVRWIAHHEHTPSGKQPPEQVTNRVVNTRYLRAVINSRLNIALISSAVDASNLKGDSVAGRNARYCFDIHRSEAGGPFQISSQALLPTWPQNLDALIKSDNEPVWSSLHPLRIMFSDLNTSLPRMLDSALYRLTSVVASPTDPDRLVDITLLFQSKSLDGKPQGLKDSITCTLDRTNFWCVTDWKVAKTAYTETIQVTYQAGPTGLPFPKLIRVETRLPGPTDGGSTDEYRFETPTAFSGSTREAYLPHYGLPEPDGWVMPWWGWLVIVSSVIVGGRLGWVYYRRQ